MSSATPPPSKEVWLWLLPALAALLPRLTGLHRQILLNDEIHTVATATYVPMAQILSSFRTEDPCLPLAALYRSLLELGVPFSELTFRLPILAASLAAVVALPLVARPILATGTSMMMAWLLALSPVLALYGGMVRPYGIVALLAPLCVLSLVRWRQGGNRKWGVAYAATGALCLWFHLGMAPMIAAPFGLLIVEKILTRRTPVSWVDLALVASLAAALVGLFAVPAWPSLQALYAAKSGNGHFSLELVPPVLALQAGTSYPAAIVAFWAFAILGLALLVAARPMVALHLATAVLAQWVGLTVLAPDGLGNPNIFNRYLIGTLPLVLAFVAVGLAFVSAGLTKVSQVYIPAILLAALFLLGPFGDLDFLRSSFMHSNDLLRFDAPTGRIAEDAIPRIYRQLAASPEKGAVAEYPFRGGWSSTRAHYVYQRVHQRRVVAVEPFALYCHPRLRLRNHVCDDPAAILGSNARFMIVHRDVLAEERRIAGGDDSGDRIRMDQWAEFAIHGNRMIRRLRRSWGAPFYQDGSVVAWDLDRVRSSRPHR